MKHASNVNAEFLLELVGSLLSSGPLRLANSEHEFKFVKGQKDTFVFVLPYLGSIASLRLWRNPQRKRLDFCKEKWLVDLAAVFVSGKRTFFASECGWVLQDIVEILPQPLAHSSEKLRERHALNDLRRTDTMHMVRASNCSNTGSSSWGRAMGRDDSSVTSQWQASSSTLDRDETDDFTLETLVQFVWM